MGRTELIKAISYLPEAEQWLVLEAAKFAAQAHEGQKRLSGEDFVEHPLAVSQILAELHLDSSSLISGLLHDVLEDTKISPEELRANFGPEVFKLVDGVTKLRHIHLHSAERRQAENLRKMVMAMAEDIRVVLIKLSDRLHNLRTASHLPPDRRTRIAIETLDIYAPLAHRLGMGQIKAELEDLALAILEPEDFAHLSQRLQKAQREVLLRDVKEKLDSELTRAGILAEILGRPKHVYSVWVKMRQDQKQLEEIYDLVAFRVLTENIPDCYATLGVIHSLWKPVPGRFKDYIATPKQNQYQSLHTTIISDSGSPVEIQIRTKDMHRLAEYGVAAHWLYKSQLSANELKQKLEWLRLLLEWQKDIVDAKQFVEAFKADIFHEEVFVFSPKGDVFSLPTGSCPIDLAYQVHTEVGHRCTGARVNGKMVRLDYELKNGEIVEILTSKKSTPSPDWLRLVKSPGAHTQLRKWFKEQKRDENIARGRQLLDEELGRLHHSSLDQVSQDKIGKALRGHSYKTFEDLLAAIGYGEVKPQTVASKLQGGDSLHRIPAIAPPAPPPKVSVQGAEGILIKLAPCCNPLPGDPIIGYVTRRTGVSIHRVGCKNAQSGSDRSLIVRWNQERTIYSVFLRVDGQDRTGMLRDVTAVLAEKKVNLENCEATIGVNGQATILLRVGIESIEQLSYLIQRMERIPGIIRVSRTHERDATKP